METDPLSKLVELDKKMTILEEKGQAIREPFIAMMKRQQDQYAMFLHVENNPQEFGVDARQVKKGRKELEVYVKSFSVTLSNWDYSIKSKKEFYERVLLKKLLSQKGSPVTLNVLKDVIEIFLTTLGSVYALQIGIVKTMEAMLEEDKEPRQYTDPILYKFN